MGSLSSEITGLAVKKTIIHLQLRSVPEKEEK
jgi:hypothetical protein